MSTRWLTDQELAEVEAKALQIGLQHKRDQLLDCLPIAIAEKLQAINQNMDQISTDLRELNREPQAGIQPIPLTLWLQCAADHAADHPSIREFFISVADRIAAKDQAEQNRAGNESTRGGPLSMDGRMLGTGADPFRPRERASLRSIRGLPDDVAELDLDTVNEREIFTNDLLPIGFLARATSLGRSVSRLLVTRFENGQQRVSLTGRPKRYFGTGWLIGKSHIITNHHVVNGRDPGEPDAAEVDLELQSKSTLVQFDFDSEDAAPEVHKVAELEHANKELDYAILRLTADSGRPAFPLWSHEVALSGEEVIPVNIIQHPGGAPKQIGMRNNLIAKVTDQNLAYFTDTKGGSSGSPVCNDVWQVVALHKAATRTFGVLEFQGKETQWVNVGTRIDRIIADLKTSHSQLWDAIDASL